MEYFFVFRQFICDKFERIYLYICSTNTDDESLCREKTTLNKTIFLKEDDIRTQPLSRAKITN